MKVPHRIPADGGHHVESPDCPCRPMYYGGMSGLDTSPGHWEHQSAETMRRTRTKDLDLDTLIIYAFRYALGRQTYASAEMSEIVRRRWSELRPDTRELILRETTRAIERGDAGMDCDVDQWRKVLTMNAPERPAPE